MTTAWAAKVLEGVPRLHPWHNEDAYIKEADALAAIARMGAGDSARLIADCELAAKVLADANTFETGQCTLREAAAHIAALTAQNREMALDVLASSGQAQEAYAAQLAAETERDALRAKVAKLVEAEEGLSAILDKHETKGPLPDVAMMLCWLAAQNIRAVLRGNILEKPE